MHENTKCPSTNLGKSEQCSGCPNQSLCSTIKIDNSIPLINKNLLNINLIISVMSGKGGVGKSTITRNLSEYLSNHFKVLILDFDLSGPSIPRLTKTEGEIINESNMLIYPIEINNNLGCISLGYFINNELIYNSSIKTNLIRNILINSCIDNYNCIIIDTPPNITDEHLAIINYLNVDYSLLISTPQKMAFQDVIRQVSFCNKNNIKILGLIENMKKFTCNNCKHVQDIFYNSNIKEMCDIKNIKYLGSLPLDMSIGYKSDHGEIIENYIFKEITDLILTNFKNKLESDL